MGASGSTEVPQSVKDFPTNRDQAISLRIEHCGSWGMEGVFNFAVDCLKTAYPKASISRNYSTEGRGQFLILFKNAKGEEVECFNKKKGDGAFNATSVMTALERIKKQAESA